MFPSALPSLGYGAGAHARTQARKRARTLTLMHSHAHAHALVRERARTRTRLGHPTWRIATLFLLLTEKMIKFNYNYRPLDDSSLQLAFSPGILAILVILTQSITVAPVELSFVDLECGRVSLFSCAVLIGKKDSLKKIVAS